MSAVVRAKAFDADFSEIGVGWEEVGEVGITVSTWLSDARGGREAVDGLLSSLSWVFTGAPVAPTASRNLVYRPLRPCETTSPAPFPLFSEDGEDRGGGAKSLNVVSASDWLAVLCILSRVLASCSRSTTEAVDTEFIESRRCLRLTGEGIDAETGDPGTGFMGVPSGIVEPTTRASLSAPGLC